MVEMFLSNLSILLAQVPFCGTLLYLPETIFPQPQQSLISHVWQTLSSWKMLLFWTHPGVKFKKHSPNPIFSSIEIQWLTHHFAQRRCCFQLLCLGWLRVFQTKQVISGKPCKTLCQNSGEVIQKANTQVSLRGWTTGKPWGFAGIPCVSPFRAWGILEVLDWSQPTPGHL